MTAAPPACPVCRARFRGSTECSRCGADLSVLMRLQAEAWKRREDARAAIRSGDLETARALVEEAQGRCFTPAGQNLGVLVAWLAKAPAPPVHDWQIPDRAPEVAPPPFEPVQTPVRKLLSEVGRFVRTVWGPKKPSRRPPP